MTVERRSRPRVCIPQYRAGKSSRIGSVALINHQYQSHIIGTTQLPMREIMRIRAFLVFAALIAIASPAPAAEFGSKDEAVAMVKRVQAEFKKSGPDATFKAVSDKSVPDFHDRDLYPFIYQDGKFLIREMVAMSRGPGS